MVPVDKFADRLSVMSLLNQKIKPINDAQSFSILNTNDLLKLRFKIYDDFPDKLIQQIQSLSDEYQIIEYPSWRRDAKHVDVELAFDVFQKLWCAFSSSLPETHPLYIPPIYLHSTDINKIIKNIILLVRVREVSQSFNPYCHPVISGVEGVGKTILIKAISIAIAVCSKSYFLSYIDCSIYNGSNDSINRVLTPLDVVTEVIYRIASTDYTGEY